MTDAGLDPGSARPGAGSRGVRSFRARVHGASPFVSGALGALLAILVYSVLVPQGQPLTAKDVSDQVARALASATPGPAVSARVYQAIEPSLVLIRTRAAAGSGTDGSGLGSGVIVTDRGDILTSLHVVANATEIRVTFADGTESSAQVVATQPENDIAVVLADQPPAQFVPATLGDPRGVRVGDDAFVVGNPFGLHGSMSAGVISGLGRSFQRPDSPLTLNGLIQIDAAVNPGNSGGPLVDRDGHVVGIVAALVNPTKEDVFIGIGLAVPIDVAGGAAGLPPY